MRRPLEAHPSFLLAALVAGDEAEAKRLVALSAATEPEGLIYCVGGDNGPVKVGWTGNWTSAGAEQRLRTLQSGNWVKLQVLAQMYGSRDDERRLHDRLRHHRIFGEWFEREPALAEFGASDEA